jgi:ABC-type branched-subunit amino acid transport system ATPase component
MSSSSETAEPTQSGEPRGVAPGPPMVLDASDITVTYGGVVAVDHVDLQIQSGQVLGVIGPNGAGKTTLIDALTGFTVISEGSIRLSGRELGKKRPSHRARRGLARTFQNLELFDDLSVRENLLVALDRPSPIGFLTDTVFPRSRLLPVDAEAIVNRLDLQDQLDVKVSVLPQGVRRMVAICRAVVQLPKVLCLDEPAAGLSGSEREVLTELIRMLAVEYSLGILLVEHDVGMVSAVCDRIVVLNFGQTIASGPSNAVLHDPLVRSAYLGSSAADRGSI